MDRSESMVERVKAAILAKRFEQQGGRFATHDNDDLGLAVAAIEAMREPTEAMARDGAGHLPAYIEHDASDRPFAANVWCAMIDAALA